MLKKPSSNFLISICCFNISLYNSCLFDCFVDSVIFYTYFVDSVIFYTCFVDLKLHLFTFNLNLVMKFNLLFYFSFISLPFCQSKSFFFVKYLTSASITEIIMKLLFMFLWMSKTRSKSHKFSFLDTGMVKWFLLDTNQDIKISMNMYIFKIIWLEIRGYVVAISF